MKNRILHILAGVTIAATLLLTTACSSSDDDEVKKPEDEQPIPDPEPDPEPADPMEEHIKQLTAPGTDERPSWTMDNSLYDQYELTMSLQVTPQKFLSEYISDDDLVCAMIGGEVRALTGAEKTDGIYYFPLVVASNGNEGFVSISYYCSALKRIYTAQNWSQFNADITPTFMGDPIEIIFDQDVYNWWMEKY